jgi:SAM-dependent methyltransferase
LQIDFSEGNAEEMQLGDASVDMVVSMYGLMFAPRPERAGAEALRVCRSGGTIALANWTPEGLIGEHFRRLVKYAPVATGAVSPLLWGDEETVRARLGDEVRDLIMTWRIAKLRYPFSPSQMVEFFRQFYGPTLRAFCGLDAEGRRRLHADLEELFTENNRSEASDVTELDGEYLEVIATRR